LTSESCTQGILTNGKITIDKNLCIGVGFDMGGEIGLLVCVKEEISPPPSGGGGGGGCFIATAVYGSSQEHHVLILRQFRDKFLLTNNLGRTFVRFYYKHSPSIANFIIDKPVLKGLIKGILLPIYWFAWLALNSLLVPTILLFNGIALNIILYKKIRGIKCS